MVKRNTTTTAVAATADSAEQGLAEPLLPPVTSTTLPEPVAVPVNDDNEEEPAVLVVEELLVDESSWEHGEVQAPTYLVKHIGFCIVFWIQFLVVCVLAIMTLHSLHQTGLPDDDDSESILPDWTATTTVYCLAVLATTVVVSASSLFLLLGPLADFMIQLSLIVGPVAYGIGALAWACVGNIGLAAMSGLFCLFGCWYACRMWSRIPFASANVATALAALKVNRSLLTLAYGVAVLMTVWSVIWGLAMIQVSYDHLEWIQSCEKNDSNEEECHFTPQGKTILVLMLCSFYWTAQVLTNVLRTTISGVVGTWWFAPLESGPTAVKDAWLRASTHSFGSICLGSLLVAILQVLQVLVSIARNQRNSQGQADSILWCLLECFVNQLERLMEYINQWAFVYIGLYGYDYFEAGHKVYELFRSRGWTVLINDHLVGRAMGIMQVLIGAMTGAASVVLGLILFGQSVHPGGTFALGWVLGVLLSNTLLQVVTRAVDTIVVCFAESPRQLIENHPPELSSRMVRAWRHTYPEVCGF